jgi:hypothetical protein
VQWEEAIFLFETKNKTANEYKLTDAVGLYKLNLETILAQTQVLATHSVPQFLPAGIYLALILLLFFHHLILFGPAHLSFHTPLYLHFQ